MVQQNYIHRLALGRSAFEAPTSRPEIAPADNQEPEAAPEAEPEAEPTEPLQADEQYIQRFDDRGHPVNSDSRSAARRLRRAQNDVLSTIGITMPMSASRPTTRSAEATAAAKRQDDLDDLEGWSSLGLTLCFEAMISASTTALHNQRIRVQTFKRYVGISISHIIASESGRQNVVSYFLAGETQFWATHVVDLVSKLIMWAVPTGLEEAWIWVFGEDRFADRRIQVVEALEASLDFATSIFLCPFYAVVTLQRLQLIPATPLCVFPWQYSSKMAYLSLLPAIPATWTLASTIQFCGALPHSPMGLTLLTELVISRMKFVLTGYSRASLTRPDNPDPKAIILAVESNHIDDKWPISDYPLLQSSLKQELARDLQWIGRTTTYYWFRLKDVFAPARVSTHHQQMLNTLLEPSTPEPSQQSILQAESYRLYHDVQELGQNLDVDDAEQVEQRLQRIEQSLARLNDQAPQAAEQGHIRERLDRASELVRNVRRELQRASTGSDSDDENENEPQPSPARHNSLQDGTRSSIDGESVEGQNASVEQDIQGDDSHRTPGASAPSVVHSSPSSSPPLEPTNVQVRTRSGSTSTLHMDVEINQTAINGSTFTTSFSASPRTSAVETAISQIISDDVRNRLPHHRVTELSMLPTDLLSQCILRAAIQILIMPLQSYQCRSISRAFLASADPGSMNEVFSPGAWFGLGLRRGRVGNAVGYISKVVFCIGAETLLSVANWLVISQAATFLGRRWFSWGKL